MTIYRALTYREGDLWVVDVEGIGVTQASSLLAGQTMARDLVVAMLEVDAADVEIEFKIRLSDGVREGVRHARQLLRAADEAQQQARAASQAIHKAALTDGMAAEDITALLGGGELTNAALADAQPVGEEVMFRQATATMRALASSSDVFETFFEHARIGLALADLTTRYVRMNDTYAALVGRAPEDIVGVPFARVLHPDDVSGEDVRTTLLLSGRESALLAEQRYVGVDGKITWVLHGVTVVPDAAGRPAWFAVSAQDITERREAEEELRTLTAVLAERATQDRMTRLANREALVGRLQAAIADDRRTGRATGLLYLDLNGFKAINDELGHAAGDDVLIAVADRLRAVAPQVSTVARMGGDEFVVLYPGATHADLEELTGRVHEALRRPVLAATRARYVGASIGSALSVGGAAEAAPLLAEADAAMYAIKRERRPS